MKLIIFGATGKTGRHLTAQAVEQGHDVTVFARNPGQAGWPSPKPKFIQGDVLDPVAVNAAICGQDAVLCTLGMPLLNKAGLRAKGTKNIIRAMEENGVKRLVCLSAFGTGDSRNALPFHYKYLIVPLLMRHLYADHGVQEEYIRASTLDWVIARPANFAKGGQTGQYRHGFTAADGPIKLKISQADVAHFMLRQIAGDAYLHKAPGLSY